MVLNLILLGWGLLFGAYVALKDLVTKTARAYERKEASWSGDIIWATILLAWVFWAAVKLQGSEVARGCHPHAFLFILGYSVVYLLLPLKYSILRRTAHE